MMHTQGIWTISEVQNFTGTLVIWLECNGKRIFSIREQEANITKEVFEANAKHICKCVNERKGLLEVCTQVHDALLALHVCEQDKSWADELRAQLSTKIAEAEKA